MYYCKIEDGKISKPAELKNLLNNVVNPGKLTQEELNNKNIYKYELPTYDTILQELGDYYLNKYFVVTREILDKTFDINEEKSKKISRIQEYISDILRSTDHYYVRYVERDKSVPVDVQSERDFIHTECDRMIYDVNLLTDVRAVISYNYNISNLTYHRRTSL